MIRLRELRRDIFVRCYALIAIALAVCSPLRAAGLEDKLKPLIEAHDGDIAVYVKNLKTGETFANRADEVMPTASLIKVAVMAEAYRQADAGLVDLDSMVTLRDEDKVPGSGILTSHFSAGTTISLRDAIHLMIVFSDNTATNLVLDKIGLPATAAYMEQLGLPNTRIHAKVFRGDTSIAPERSQKYGLGSTTAAEMAKLFEWLSEGKLVSKKASEEMLGHLRACEDRAKLLRFLPSNLKIAHKTGSVSKSRTDAALIESGAGPIVVCVLTTGNADQSWGDHNAAEIVCGRIGQAVYEYFNPVAVTKKTVPTGRLESGDMGELVEALQRTLNARLDPSPGLSVDGDFGPVTRAAVERFQEAHGIAANGVVESPTWKALGTLITENAPVPDPAVVNAEVLPQEPADPLTGPPFVTCKAWAIADADAGDVLWGEEADRSLDIASTTKIMTAYVVLSLAEKSPEILQEVVVFSPEADETPGSTSGLKAGEKISVEELLYGLLLPSGNDASVALAEHFGSRFGDDDSIAALERFVAEMNRRAKALGMTETHFVNPHGLTAPGHQASARDLVRLASAAMKLAKFRHYVGTRQHGTTVDGPGGYRRNVLWKNTNELLAIGGFEGVKTGTTGAAGACLVSLGERDGRRLLMVVLGATSSDARYTDSRNLYRWAWKQLAGGGK